eukprot:1159679-Pelagomonas_calceolata.AAC.3
MQGRHKPRCRTSYEQTTQQTAWTPQQERRMLCTSLQAPSIKRVWPFQTLCFTCSILIIDYCARAQRTIVCYQQRESCGRADKGVQA